jgi:alpha-amylase
MIKTTQVMVILLLTLFNPIVSKSKSEWKSRAIYQLLTDRFARSNGDTSECNLHKYCGGDFKGIKENLHYIAGMGFNAIWISPVLENTPDSYHGYHFTNLYEINPYFGTEQDLIDLIEACHEMDIWVMVDVVANHVGPVGTDFTGIHPFNDPLHYHDYCVIGYDDFLYNQWRVEVN